MYDVSLALEFNLNGVSASYLVYASEQWYALAFLSFHISSDPF